MAMHFLLPHAQHISCESNSSFSRWQVKLLGENSFPRAPRFFSSIFRFSFTLHACIIYNSFRYNLLISCVICGTHQQIGRNEISCRDQRFSFFYPKLVFVPICVGLIRAYAVSVNSFIPRRKSVGSRICAYSCSIMKLKFFRFFSSRHSLMEPFEKWLIRS